MNHGYRHRHRTRHRHGTLTQLNFLEGLNIALVPANMPRLSFGPCKKKICFWSLKFFLFFKFGGIVFLKKLYGIMLEIDWVYLFLGFVNLEGQVLAPPLFCCTFFFIINLMGLVC